MSVGHVARAIEESGIPTVSVFVRSFRHVAERMGVPRTVVTRNPMGRPMGAAGDTERQAEVLESAFSLLETADRGGSVLDLEVPFRPGRTR